MAPHHGAGGDTAISGPALLIINTLATWYLIGLIWLVQVVHYPLFQRVGVDRFVEYQRKHADRITPLVGLPMVAELVSAWFLWTTEQTVIPNTVAGWGLSLVVMIWLSTAVIQVPLHRRLADGFDPELHRWLVLSNWIRTLLWTSRGALLSYWLWQALRT